MSKKMEKKVTVIDQRHTGGFCDVVTVFIKKEEVILFFYSEKKGANALTCPNYRAMVQMSRRIGPEARFSGDNIRTPDFSIWGSESDQNFVEARAALTEYLKSQGA